MPPLLFRAWSRRPGLEPGVYLRGCLFPARVSLDGRWVYLGSFPTRWEANRVGRVARRLKDAGELDGCTTASTVRERVAAELAQINNRRGCASL